MSVFWSYKPDAGTGSIFSVDRSLESEYTINSDRMVTILSTHSDQGVIILQTINDHRVTEVNVMPEALFFQLEEEKRKRIIDAGIREFADQSYNEASTNHLVKAAGISKGSLFKYFAHKEDLYFYLLDSVLTDLMAGIKDEIADLEGDLFEVIIRYAKIEFDWHLKNPDHYRLMKRAFTDDRSEMYQKTLERYNAQGDSMYDQLLKNVDTSKLLWDKNKVLKLVKWVLEGFNKEYMEKDTGFEAVEISKELYINELKEYLEMIKIGIHESGKKSKEGGDHHA